MKKEKKKKDVVLWPSSNERLIVAFSMRADGGGFFALRLCTCAAVFKKALKKEREYVERSGERGLLPSGNPSIFTMSPTNIGSHLLLITCV